MNFFMYFFIFLFLIHLLNSAGHCIKQVHLIQKEKHIFSRLKYSVFLLTLILYQDRHVSSLTAILTEVSAFRFFDINFDTSLVMSRVSCPVSLLKQYGLEQETFFCQVSGRLIAGYSRFIITLISPLSLADFLRRIFMKENNASCANVNGCCSVFPSCHNNGVHIQTSGVFPLFNMQLQINYFILLTSL